MYKVRLTQQSLQVLRVLLERGEISGFDIVKTTGLSTGTVYPILTRLYNAKWVNRRWEPDKAGPKRRLHQLTPLGKTESEKAFQELSNLYNRG